MVSINLTLFVLLAMFLGFLWIMHRFVFKPTLALTDSRDDRIAEDRELANAESTKAAVLEDDYATAIAEMHRDANLRIVRNQRLAQEEHNTKVEAFKRQAEEDLRSLRASIKSDIAAQADQFDGLARQIAATMAKQLELE